MRCQVTRIQVENHHIVDVIEECRLFFDFFCPVKCLKQEETSLIVNCSNVLNYFGLKLIV